MDETVTEVYKHRDIEWSWKKLLEQLLVLYQSFQFLPRLKKHPRWGRPDFLHQHGSVRQVVYLIVLLQVWSH